MRTRHRLKARGPAKDGRAFVFVRDVRTTHMLDQRMPEPGRPNQDACIESFNGGVRDECLNEHRFTSLTNARS